MTGLIEAVERIFTNDGPLAQVDAHFRVREGQTEMALAVAQTVDQGGALVVEAGTGVGKTFAYLVPALLSGERVVISTATKTLQDQLFGRDLPAVIRALKLPARMALLKGRANYLCLYRMGLARQEGLFPDRYVVTLLAKVEKWLGVRRFQKMLRLPSSQRGVGERRGRDQPPFVFCRHVDERKRHGRVVAQCAGGDF